MAAFALTRTDVMNQHVKADSADLARAFDSAQPFRHVQIEDFLTPELAEQLLQDFPAFDPEHATGETGKPGQKATHRDVRKISAAYREVDDYIQTSDFLGVMSEISGIPDLMYDAEYHGGGTHENLHGAGLYTHVDFNYHPKGWHRRLNLIIYLSPEWNEDWGGSLELHSNPWEPRSDEVKTLQTGFNGAVLFETSEQSWHGFRVIRLPEDRRHLSRKSFAIYLYTKDRPADQTAANHSTIYVPSGLPDDIRAGKTLTAEEVQRLQRRFSEYRHMLKLQYDRQLQMSEEFRAGYRMDLQGYAVQTRAPAGRFSDGWASSDFSMEFTATKPVRGLLLELKIPAEMRSEQTLEISAGGWSGTEVMQPGEERVLQIPVSVAAGSTVEVAIHAGTTYSPGGADTRELAYLIRSAALEH